MIESDLTRRQLFRGLGLTGVAIAVGACGAPRPASLPATPAPPPAPAFPERVDGFAPLPVRGGGFVTGIAAHDNGTLYVRTDVGGAYRRDGGTGTWVQLIRASAVPSPHWSDYLVEGLVCAPTNANVVYASVGSTGESTLPGRVLRSADGGLTWAASARSWYVAGNEEGRLAASRLAVDPTNADVVYLGTRRDGLHLSVDGGRTWTRKGALPSRDSGGQSVRVGVTGIAVDQASPLRQGRHQGLWAGAENVGLCRSADGGDSWTVAVPFENGWVRDIVLTRRGEVYACLYAPTASERSAVYRVGADGLAVTVSPPAACGWASVAVDPANPDVVFVAADGVNNDGRLFRTRNAGAPAPAWDALQVSIADGEGNTVWPASSDISNYMSTGQMRIVSGVLWFAEGMGVWQAAGRDGTAVEWRFSSTGIEELVANGLYKPPGAPLITASWDRGLFRHPSLTNSDAGRNAAYLPYRTGFGSAWALAGCPTDQKFMVAILDDHQDPSGQTYPERRASGYSDDGGQTWTRFAALGNGTAPADMLFGNIAVSAGQPDNIVWIPSNLGGLGSRVYFTTDRGTTWQAGRLDGLDETDVLHAQYTLDRHILAAHPTRSGTFFALGTGGGDGSGRLWQTIDGGASWQKVAARGPGPRDVGQGAHLVLAGDPAQFVVVGAQAGYRSTDGAQWESLTSISGAAGLAVGAPAQPGGSPGLFLHGTVDGVEGVHWSQNLGHTWKLVVQYPNDCFQRVRGLTGDPEIPGQVYLGFAGTGYAFGRAS